MCAIVDVVGTGPIRRHTNENKQNYIQWIQISNSVLLAWNVCACNVCVCVWESQPRVKYSIIDILADANISTSHSVETIEFQTEQIHPKWRRSVKIVERLK